MISMIVEARYKKKNNKQVIIHSLSLNLIVSIIPFLRIENFIKIATNLTNSFLEPMTF